MAIVNFTTNDSINVPVSGIGTGDSINEVTIVWIKVGTDDVGGSDLTSQTNLANAATAAIAANRYRTLVAGPDTAAIAALQTSVGTPINVGTLTDAATYVPAIRWTENMSGGGTQSGVWTKGSAIVYWSNPTVNPGLLDFETSTLTPIGRSTPYVLSAATVSIDDTVAHGGTKSVKLLPKAGGIRSQIHRTLSFPSTGRITFTRWVRFNNYAGVAGGYPFGLSSDPQVTKNYILASLQTDGASGSFGYFNRSYVFIQAAGGLAANTWYRVVVTVDCDDYTFDIAIYNASGTKLGELLDLLPLEVGGSFKNQALTTWVGGIETGPTGFIMWADDLIDGI